MKLINAERISFNFISLCLGLLLLYLFLPKTLTGLDDSVYLNLAKDLFSAKTAIGEPGSSTAITSNIFSFRVTWLFCVWLGIKIFGMNIFAVSFPALLSTLATALLVYKLTNHKLYAVLFFVFSPAIFQFSLSGTPDTLLMFFFTLAYYTIHQQQQRRNDFKNAIILGSALFLGFLTKELIVFIIPLLAFLLIKDVAIKKTNHRFWLIALFVSIFLFGGYFLYYKLTTGSFFYRFAVFNKNQYVSFCSYDILPTIEVVKRITLGIPFLIITTLSICLLLPFILINKTQKIPEKLIHLAILLLTINFASIKFGSYSPMCLEMRHYLFVFPVACILLGDLKDFKSYRLKLTFGYLLALAMLLVALYLKYQLKKDYQVTYIDLLFYAVPLFALMASKNKSMFQAAVFTTLFFFSIYTHMLGYRQSMGNPVNRITK